MVLDFLGPWAEFEGNQAMWGGKKWWNIGKFVILRYDKILHTEYAKPTARKSSKASRKQSAKSPCLAFWGQWSYIHGIKCHWWILNNVLLKNKTVFEKRMCIDSSGEGLHFTVQSYKQISSHWSSGEHRFLTHFFKFAWDFDFTNIWRLIQIMLPDIWLCF